MHLPDGASPRRRLSQGASQRRISLGAASSRWRFAAEHLPAGSVFPMALRTGTSARSCSPVLVCIFPMALCHGGASHKVLCHGAPTSNKPHPAEKRTPVWLAIWHIWAGFANSQLQCATFHSTYSYKFTSSLLPTCNRCSDIANLSARLHRLPTPPPYLRWMRLSPGRWRRSLVQDEAVAWPGCRCGMLDMAIAWPVAAFLQITEHASEM